MGVFRNYQEAANQSPDRRARQDLARTNSGRTKYRFHPTVVDAEDKKSCAVLAPGAGPTLRRFARLRQEQDFSLLPRRCVQAVSRARSRSVRRYRAVPLRCAAARHLEPPGAIPKARAVPNFFSPALEYGTAPGCRARPPTLDNGLRSRATRVRFVCAG